MVVEPQRQIHHFLRFRHDLGSPGKAGTVKSLPVKSSFLDEAVVAVPVVRDEGLAFDADLVEELLAGFVITATHNPGDGSLSHRVVGPPYPEPASFFFG